MSYAHISYLSGFFILILSGAMMPPFFLSLGTTDALIFLSLALGGVFISGLLIFANKSQSTEHVSVQEAFILTTLVWLISIIIGALPLYLGSTELSITDAIFQSTSMITTTGANLIPDLEYTNRGILLWCSILQWLGGKGIILMGLMIMPFLRIGGVQLLHTESSNKVEKFLPRVTRMAALIFLVYAVLTFLCAVLLWGLG